MNTLPQTPPALLEELFSIFPQYRSNYVDYGPLHDFPPTFHSILIEFTVFFGAELISFSQKQLKQFGALVSAAVAQDGELENAFETCLLEHLHQIRAERVMRPYLSNLAREKTTA